MAYAGCHSWAIPTTCGDVDGARALVERLSGFELAALDATGGTVPAHVEAFAAVTPHDDVDARRLAITRDTIATGMITYPPLEQFPAIEDAGWQHINAVLRGESTTAAALTAIQQVAESVLS